jgi:hypothetical protein
MTHTYVILEVSKQAYREIFGNYIFNSLSYWKRLVTNTVSMIMMVRQLSTCTVSP